MIHDSTSFRQTSAEAVWRRSVGQPHACVKLCWWVTDAKRCAVTLTSTNTSVSPLLKTLICYWKKCLIRYKSVLTADCLILTVNGQNSWDHDSSISYIHFSADVCLDLHVYTVSHTHITYTYICRPINSLQFLNHVVKDFCMHAASTQCLLTTELLL